MLCGRHVLTILALLPFSLSVLFTDNILVARNANQQSISPAKHHRNGRAVTNEMPWIPKKRSGKSVLKSKTPKVKIGGYDVKVVRTASRNSLKKRATGNGTILDLGNTANTFIIPVTIGTPPTTYPLQLDLGSSDLLIASTNCTSTSCPVSLGTTKNPYYDTTKSSTTFQAINANSSLWRTSFGDGTIASGVLAQEKVGLGGVFVESQVIGMINATNLTLAQQQISGILGLGFPRLSVLTNSLLPVAALNISSEYLPPILESLFTSPLVPYPVFGLALVPPPQNVTSSSTSTSPSPSASSRYSATTGTLTLGGVSSLFVSSQADSGTTLNDIEWWDVVPFGEPIKTNRSSTSISSSVPATSSAVPTSADQNRVKRANPASIQDLASEQYLFWALSLRNVSINGTDVGLNSTYSSLGLPSIALLDVGSNGIYGPQQDVEKIFKAITDARLVSEGQWAVPCDTKMTMGFSFGGRYVQLQPSDWMYAQVKSSTFCLAWPVAMPSSGDGIDWQLGTPFLRNVYSIFSYGINGLQGPLIGFLPIASSNDPTPPTSTTLPSSTTSSSTTLSTSLNPDSPTPTHINPLSLTVTVDTTLPNDLIDNPTFTTPSYVFSASPDLLTPGAIQTEGLANGSIYTVHQVPVITPTTNTSSASPTTGGSGTGTTAGDRATNSGARLRSGVNVLILSISFAAVLGRLEL